MTKDEIKNEVFLNEDKLNSVSDKVITDYEDFIKMERIISNNLVGEIKEGEYYISDELKELFVVNKKLLIQREDDFIIAKLQRGECVYKFKLSFEEFDTNTMIAEFYIIENFEGKILETFIANYVDVKNYEFKKKAREAFNILLEESEYLKEEEEDFEELDKVIFRNKVAKNDERVFIMETYAELYVMEMLDALSKGGEKSKEILKEYNKIIADKGLQKTNIPHIYIKLKEELDTVIEQKGGIKEVAKENPEIKKPIERYIKPVKEFDKTLMNIDILIKKQEDKEEKKEIHTEKKQESKKSSPKPQEKKSGKSSSSKGGKKKDAKKESGGKKGKSKEIEKITFFELKAKKQEKKVDNNQIKKESSIKKANDFVKKKAEKRPINPETIRNALHKNTAREEKKKEKIPAQSGKIEGIEKLPDGDVFDFNVQKNMNGEGINYEVQKNINKQEAIGDIASKSLSPETLIGQKTTIEIDMIKF